MTSTAPTMGRVSGRLRLVLAGAVVLTALTMATAAAAPTTMGEQADAGPRSLTPGFLLDRGRYITLEVPGATVETGAVGINNRGEIVGGARGGGRPDHGFLRDPRGHSTTFRFPGSRSTAAQKVNDRGQVTGLYSNTTDDPRAGADLTGFLLDPRGRYTRIAVPGALTTTAVGVNDRGQVVGQYQTPDGRFHGYLWERGRTTTIDVPGAVATSLVDINDRGQILGGYADDLTQRPGTFHGFVLDRGRFRTFDGPAGTLLLPGDLNDRGQVVGATIDPASGTARGFLLARGIDGPVTTVSVPGAPSTFAFGLNDRGQVTGTYNNPSAAPGPPPATAPSMGRMS
jgi:probable HAF family extracellular repeat protein